MIIECKNCTRKFTVNDNQIPTSGRLVRCGYCSVTWHQMPLSLSARASYKKTTSKIIEKQDESPSVESIKASDGKTYKFLGSQWAELLPSGKTGLFAKKKIGNELDKITGRKVKKTPRKKQKRIEDLNPSGNISEEKKLPDIYQPKEGLGFFGYVFLIIIIGFSLVGILKTFEIYLTNYFPELEYIFIVLNEQISFFAETVKNIITIVKDLIGSY